MREIIVKFTVLQEDIDYHPQLVIEDALGDTDWLGFEILADAAEIDESIPRRIITPVPIETLVAIAVSRCINCGGYPEIWKTKNGKYKFYCSHCCESTRYFDNENDAKEAWLKKMEKLLK